MVYPTIATLLILASTVTIAAPDWTDCPTACRCKWSSGKKSAFCRESGFTAVPVLNADIQVLDLTGNSISYLTRDAFKSIGLIHLQRIFLRHTNLREVHQDAFKDLLILIEVDLSDNKIESLYPATFTGNDRLRFLNLSGNPLMKLNAEQFPKLPHLRTIELQHCNIHTIHVNAFKNLTSLESLNLNSNLLRNISELVFKSINKLKTLNLDYNPWVCDCHLRQFRNWLLHSNLYSQPLSCVEPPVLVGHHWEDLPDIGFACSPSVSVTDHMIQVEVGGNVTFKCHVSGDPEPDVSWLFNGHIVNGSVGDQVFLDEQMGLDKWIILSVYNVTEAGAGEYTCFARNTRGNATDNATLLLPEVITATTLSKAESWLLVAGLVAGGVATFFSVTLTIICTLCLCGRKRRRKRHRRKAKLKGSVSFTEQEKKLLDVSITTTERPSGAESVEQLGHAEMEMMESASIPLELCEPVHITIESHAPEPGSGNMVPLSVPLTVFPPPPEFSTSVLPSGTFGNIYISVSVNQEHSQDGIVRYPDLLDIPHRSKKNTSASVSVATGPDAPYAPTQTFATLPRRPRPKPHDSVEPLVRLAPVYDNMGPRVTAGGSSTLSLPDADDNDIPPPPPPPICAPMSVDYVSL